MLTQRIFLRQRKSGGPRYIVQLKFHIMSKGVVKIQNIVQINQRTCNLWAKASPINIIIGSAFDHTFFDYYK